MATTSLTNHRLRRTSTANVDAAVRTSDVCRRSADNTVCAVAQQLRAISLAFSPLTAPPSGCALASGVVAEAVVHAIDALITTASKEEQEAVRAAEFMRLTAFAANGFMAATDPTGGAHHAQQDTQSLLDAVTMMGAINSVHNSEHAASHTLHADEDDTIAQLASALNSSYAKITRDTQEAADLNEVIRTLDEHTTSTAALVVSANGKESLCTDTLQRHVDSLFTRCIDASKLYDAVENSVVADDYEDPNISAGVANMLKSLYHVQKMTAFHALIVAAHTLHDVGCDDITIPALPIAALPADTEVD